MMNRHAPWPQRLVAIAIVAAWLLMIMLMGSRGGPLRVMILIGIAAFAIHGNPISSIARVLTIVVVTFAASAAMYPIGTMIRFVHTSGDDAAAALANNWFRSGQVFEDPNAWPLRRALSQSATLGRVARVTSPVITRLGLIDYPIVIITREPDQAIIDHYLAIDYGLKNFANNMVPGELYPDHDVMTSRVFGMAYRGFDETHIRSYFLSEPWTLWGFAWLQGGAIGGLLIIIGLAALTQIGYGALLYLSGPLFGPYIGTAYLFVPVTSGLLQLFGLDHWLTISAHFAIAMLTCLAVTYGFALVKDMFLPRASKPT